MYRLLKRVPSYSINHVFTYHSPRLLYLLYYHQHNKKTVGIIIIVKSKMYYKSLSDKRHKGKRLWLKSYMVPCFQIRR